MITIIIGFVSAIFFVLLFRGRIIEALIVLAFVGMLIMSSGIYIKRGVQGRIRSAEDDKLIQTSEEKNFEPSYIQPKPEVSQQVLGQSKEDIP